MSQPAISPAGISDGSGAIDGPIDLRQRRPEPRPGLAASARLKSAVATLAVAAVCGLLVSTIGNPGPYRVDTRALSGWKLAMEPGGLAFVQLEPPAALSDALFRQASERGGPALVAPARPSVPLVLQTEYEDSLQGVLSTEDILNLARDTGVDAASFEPVCLGRRTDATSGPPRELWFVVFASQNFDRFRQQLTPLFPEHAGSAPYNPNAVRPILPIAATDEGFASWWPLSVGPTDCRDSLLVD